MATTIFEKVVENQEELKRKIDNLGKKAAKEAERKVMKQRITEISRGMNFWERCELAIKIFS